MTHMEGLDGPSVRVGGTQPQPRLPETLGGIKLLFHNTNASQQHQGSPVSIETTLFFERQICDCLGARKGVFLPSYDLQCFCSLALNIAGRLRVCQADSLVSYIVEEY